MKDWIKGEAKSFGKALLNIAFIAAVGLAAGFGFMAGMNAAHRVYVNPVTVVDESDRAVGAYVPFAGIIGVSK